eukprot:847239-Rhodomonas_salina.1
MTHSGSGWDVSDGEPTRRLAWSSFELKKLCVDCRGQTQPSARPRRDGQVAKCFKFTGKLISQVAFNVCSWYRLGCPDGGACHGGRA